MRQRLFIMALLMPIFVAFAGCDKMGGLMGWGELGEDVTVGPYQFQLPKRFKRAQNRTASMGVSVTLYAGPAFGKSEPVITVTHGAHSPSMARNLNMQDMVQAGLADVRRKCTDFSYTTGTPSTLNGMQALRFQFSGKRTHKGETRQLNGVGFLVMDDSHRAVVVGIDSGSGAAKSIPKVRKVAANIPKVGIHSSGPSGPVAQGSGGGSLASAAAGSRGSNSNSYSSGYDSGGDSPSGYSSYPSGDSYSGGSDEDGEEYSEDDSDMGYPDGYTGSGMSGSGGPGSNPYGSGYSGTGMSGPGGSSRAGSNPYGSGMGRGPGMSGRPGMGGMSGRPGMGGYPGMSGPRGSESGSNPYGSGGGMSGRSGSSSMGSGAYGSGYSSSRDDYDGEEDGYDGGGDYPGSGYGSAGESREDMARRAANLRRATKLMATAEDSGSTEYLPANVELLEVGNAIQQKGALGRLKKLGPEDFDDTALRTKYGETLCKVAKDPMSDIGVRRDVIPLLVKWDAGESVPVLIELLRASHQFIQGDALEQLATLKDERCIEAVTQLFVNNIQLREEAGDCLREFGPVAEDKVLELSRPSDVHLTRATVKLLGDIGTRKSIGPLKLLRGLPFYGHVKTDVSRATSRIRRREEAGEEESS